MDVKFFWVLHRLSPTDYESDCIKLFGAPLPTENGLDFVTVRNSFEPCSFVARLQCNCYSSAVRRLEGKQLFRYIACRKERKAFLPCYLWPKYEINRTIGEFQFSEAYRGFLVRKWNSPCVTPWLPHHQGRNNSCSTLHSVILTTMKRYAVAWTDIEKFCV